MNETPLSRAVKNAAAADQTQQADLCAKDFEKFLGGIVVGVIKNMLAVRAGELTPDEASERDDATVRTLAQILMAEHDRIKLHLSEGNPQPGPELIEAMKTNLPALFRDLPEGADPHNPRVLAVHAGRVFMREIYTMIKAAAAEGDLLTTESLNDRVERTAFVWSERFLGDTLNESK